MARYPRLSEREREVLETLMVCDNAQTAALKLGISPASVYVYVSRVRDKIRQAKRFLRSMNRYAEVLETLDFKLRDEKRW